MCGYSVLNRANKIASRTYRLIRGYEDKVFMTKQFKESALSSIFALFLSFVFAYVLNEFMGLLSIPTAIITSLFIKNSLDIIFIKRNLGFFVFKPA